MKKVSVYFIVSLLSLGFLIKYAFFMYDVGSEIKAMADELNYESGLYEGE